MNIFVMAWRNLWRNRRRTLITLAAMTVALVVEILYSGLVVGMMTGMQEDVVELQLGDVQVHTAEYLERPSLYEVIAESDSLLAYLDGIGYPAAPRLLGGALAASGDFSSGVQLRGVDVERELGVTRLHEHIGRGEWLSDDDPYGVVIGVGLARALSVDLGGEIVMLSQGADGSMANALFTVRGVLSSVAQGTDRGAIFLVDDTFRDVMAVDTGAHEIVIRKPGPDVTDADAKAAVEGWLDQAHPTEPVRVMTWREIEPIVGQMLDSVSGMMWIMFSIVYLAVALLILNSMLMVVFERIREFGVLKSIGAGPLRVFALIVVEALLQAVVALVVGLTLAAPLAYAIQLWGIPVGNLSGVDMMGVAMRPVWYGHYGPGQLIAPVVLLFVIVLLAVVYPAFKASIVRPIQAMHPLMEVSLFRIVLGERRWLDLQRSLDRFRRVSTPKGGAE